MFGDLSVGFVVCERKEPSKYDRYRHGIRTNGGLYLHLGYDTRDENRAVANTNWSIFGTWGQPVIEREPLANIVDLR